MCSKIDLNSLFSVGLGRGRKSLIAEIISLHVSLDRLFDVFVFEGKIVVAGNKTFYKKAISLKCPELKGLILRFNSIRNLCAHERMDKQVKVSEVIAKCKSLIPDTKKIYEDKFKIVESACVSPLQSAITVIFDELASIYGCTTPRDVELDGLYAPGQKTLDDEIYEVIGVPR